MKMIYFLSNDQVAMTSHVAMVCARNTFSDWRDSLTGGIRSPAKTALARFAERAREKFAARGSGSASKWEPVVSARSLPCELE